MLKSILIYSFIMSSIILRSVIMSLIYAVIQQGACGVERSKIPAWQRCPADAEDSSNPNSEYSDSECSILDSGLENDERGRLSPVFFQQLYNGRFL